MAAHDKKERNKWNLRVSRVLSEAGAPVIAGLPNDDMKLVVEMTVGRSRPSTVRLRVRAWEAFSRWLVLNRARPWPEGPADLVDYLQAMVDVPAPWSFPSSFGRGSTLGDVPPRLRRRR